MVEKIEQPIKIDLNQFKLHIGLKNRIELTLHFDSPSRKFYLSIIAFVVNEMKKRGKITSILLEEHLDLLALLNETIGGSAGSSDKENLLRRIYRKWKDALPNLEDAPLFKVLGRKKEYYEETGKAYQFTEAEKDNWANLFEYKGSEENVRLRFAIDKLGISLNDIIIIYENFLNTDAWERFISSLKKKAVEIPKAEPINHVSEEPEVPTPQWGKRKVSWLGRYQWAALIATIIVVLGAITLVIWKTYLKPTPVRVASIKRMTLPLPEKPSIAVLPFVNMGGDKSQEYFCDGLTEDIINAMSKNPYVFVIARNSTFTYKNKQVKVQQVAEEMGVQYVLEGSVQWSADRIRITVQLIDALKGHHVFSERYDRKIGELFSLRDEITIKVLSGMRVVLTEGLLAQTFEKGTKNLDAYSKVQQARGNIQVVNKENLSLARQQLEEAVKLDSQYASAYAMLSYVNVYEVWLGVSKLPEESLNRAEELGRKALTLDQSLAYAHSALSLTYVFKRQFDKGISEAEQSVSLAPNSAISHHQLGTALLHAERFEDAIPHFKKSLRLSPIPISVCLQNLAVCYRLLGRYDEAIETGKRLIQLWPDHLPGHLSLAASYVLSGHEEEAHAEAMEVLRIDPKFSLERYMRVLPFRNQTVIDKMAETYRKAGLK